jgi:hypothetical protein
MSSLDPRLASILVCPKCRAKLEGKTDGYALVCRTCRTVYPVRDGIPILLPSEAVPLEPDR